MTYVWREGHKHKVDAEKAHEVMASLEEAGSLTPEKLVEVSRPEDAVLHDEFTWDDAKAAEEYRKEEARHLIRAIIVIPDEEDTIHEPVRAFFKIYENREQGYEDVFTIISEEQKLAKLQAQAHDELVSYRNKYSTILSLTGVGELIDEAEKKLATQTA